MGFHRTPALLLSLLFVSGAIVGDTDARDAAAAPDDDEGEEERREVHIIHATDMGGPFKTWITRPLSLLAFSDLEQRGFLSGFKIVPHFVDSECNTGTGIDVIYRELYSGPPKLLVLGPLCSNVCTATAEITTIWNVTQISGTCVDPALSNKEKYPRFFRTASSDVDMVYTRLEILKHFHWKRVALFHGNIGPFAAVTETMTKVLESSSLLTDFSVVLTESLGKDPRPLIKVLMDKDARIIIGGAINLALSPFFCEVYKLGFYGSHITWLLPGYYVEEWYELYPETHDCSPSQILETIQDVIYTENSWKSMTNLPSFTGHTQADIDDLVSKWQRNVTVESDVPFIAGSTYDSSLAVGLALNYTQTLLTEKGMSRTLADFTYADTKMADLITSGFENLGFQGVMGFIKFNELHDYQADCIIYQQKGSEKRYVGWHDKRQNLVTWVNGGITWKAGEPPVDDTRVILENLYVSKGLYVGIVSVACLGALMNIGFMIFNIYFRNLRVIKMSSPNINSLILVGCIISFLSVIFEVNEYTKNLGNSICSLKTAIFIVGFSLAFGGLFSKTFRVHLILTRASKTAKRTIISDTQLLLIVAALVLVNLLVITAWQIYDPYQLQWRNVTSTVQQEKQYAESVIIYRIPSCDSEYKMYFQGALFVIQGALLAFASFLAWETRKVKLVALNDSKQIGVCIYNVGILSIIGAAISMVIKDNPDAGYGFTSAFLIAGTTTVSTVLFIPKIMAMTTVEVEPAEAHTMSTHPPTRSAGKAPSEHSLTVATTK